MRVSGHAVAEGPDYRNKGPRGCSFLAQALFSPWLAEQQGRFSPPLAPLKAQEHERMDSKPDDDRKRRSQGRNLRSGLLILVLGEFELPDEGQPCVHSRPRR